MADAKKKQTTKAPASSKHVEKLSQPKKVAKASEQTFCLRKMKHFCTCKKVSKVCGMTDNAKDIEQIARNVRQEVRSLQSDVLEFEQLAKELDKEAKKRK